jgi:hypothetical protein
MRYRHTAVPLLMLALGACVVVETGVDIPCRIGTRDVVARVWVQPDASTSGQGEWLLWFDLLLVPVDAVASLVWPLTGNHELSPTRTRGPRLLAVPIRIAAALLPLVTACPELYVGKRPAFVILGLDYRGGARLERVCVPEGSSNDELRNAIVDALCQLEPAIPRATVDRRVHSVDLPPFDQ